LLFAPSRSHLYNNNEYFPSCQPPIEIFFGNAWKLDSLPDFDGFVLTGADESLAIGGESDGVDWQTMTCEGAV